MTKFISVDWFQSFISPDVARCGSLKVAKVDNLASVDVHSIDVQMQRSLEQVDIKKTTVTGSIRGSIVTLVAFV